MLAVVFVAAAIINPSTSSFLLRARALMHGIMGSGIAERNVCAARWLPLCLSIAVKLVEHGLGEDKVLQ